MKALVSKCQIIGLINDARVYLAVFRECHPASDSNIKAKTACFFRNIPDKVLILPRLYGRTHGVRSIGKHSHLVGPLTLNVERSLIIQRWTLGANSESLFISICSRQPCGETQTNAS